jgi:hypothetical protein
MGGLSLSARRRVLRGALLAELVAGWGYATPPFGKVRTKDGAPTFEVS